MPSLAATPRDLLLSTAGFWSSGPPATPTQSSCHPPWPPRPYSGALESRKVKSWPRLSFPLPLPPPPPQRTHRQSLPNLALSRTLDQHSPPGRLPKALLWPSGPQEPQGCSSPAPASIPPPSSAGLASSPGLPPGPFTHRTQRRPAEQALLDGGSLSPALRRPLSRAPRQRPLPLAPWSPHLGGEGPAGGGGGASGCGSAGGGAGSR